MFDVIHQTVQLRICPENTSVDARVEWIVLPSVARLDTILIQFRRTPSRITCNGVSCKFQVRSLASGANLDGMRDLATLERYVEDLSDLRENGELVLFLPETCRQVGTLEEACSDQLALAHAVNVSATDTIDYAPLVVGFEYTLPMGGDGLVCLDENQLYVTPAACDVVRWLPCVDRARHANTWQLSFSVPLDWTVLCTGARTQSGTNGVWQFDQTTPLRARSIGFCMGRLKCASDTQPQPSVVCWTLATATATTRMRAAEMQTMVLPDMVAWFHECTQIEMPFQDSYHMVFLPRLGMSRWDACGFGNLMLVEERYLFDARCLDGVYLGTAELANVLSRAWWDGMLRLETYACTWILHGLVDWLANQFLKKVFGANHIRYRRLRVSQEVRAIDSLPAFTTARPLQWAGYLFSSELNQQLYRDKAGVIMSMLEQFLGASSFLQMIRQQIIPHHCLHHNKSTETTPVGLSTDILLDMCVDVLNGLSVASALACGSGSATAGSASTMPTPSTYGISELVPIGIDRRKEVTAFFDQWVRCNGYPVVQVQCRYSNKNKTMLVHVTQQDPPTFNPNHLRFHGPIVFRIHELARTHDQTYILPQQHDNIELHTREAYPSMAASPMALSSGTLQLEYICTSRVRRNRKRKRFEADVLEALPLDRLLIRHNSTPLLYLRCDPSLTWFNVFLTQQNPIHVLYQLVHEKTVYGQYEAITNAARLWRETLTPSETPGVRSAKYNLLADGEERMPDNVFAKALYMLVEDRRTYYPIRILAAKAIAEACSWSQENVRFLRILLRGYRMQFFHPNRDEPLPNDFTDLCQYMMRRHLPLAFAVARVPSTTAGIHALVTPNEVVHLILICLRQNNNIRNHGLVDTYYLASLIDALSMVRSNDLTLVLDTWNEVKRYLDCEPIMPSHNQLVAITGLRCLAELERNHPDLNNVQCNYLSYAVGGNNSYGVRVAAFQAVIKLLAMSSRAKYAIVSMTSMIQAAVDEGALELCTRMLKSLWNDLLQQQCPVQVFHAREIREEIVKWMSMLWTLLLMCIQRDTSLAAVTWALYYVIWGRDLPLFAPSTITPTKPTTAQSDARRIAAPNTAARRRALARQTLQQLRGLRQFKVPKKAPAPTPPILNDSDVEYL